MLGGGVYVCVRACLWRGWGCLLFCCCCSGMLGYVPERRGVITRSEMFVHRLFLLTLNFAKKNNIDNLPNFVSQHVKKIKKSKPINIVQRR